MLSNRSEVLDLVLFLNGSFIYKLYCFGLNLTFPSAVKVFHQRDHCTVSVGNGERPETLSAQHQM